MVAKLPGRVMWRSNRHAPANMGERRVLAWRDILVLLHTDEYPDIPRREGYRNVSLLVWAP
jgi:hypothetical protein